MAEGRRRSARIAKLVEEPPTEKPIGQQKKSNNVKNVESVVKKEVTNKRSNKQITKNSEASQSKTAQKKKKTDPKENIKDEDGPQPSKKSKIVKNKKQPEDAENSNEKEVVEKMEVDDDEGNVTHDSEKIVEEDESDAKNETPERPLSALDRPRRSAAAAVSYRHRKVVIDDGIEMSTSSSSEEDSEEEFEILEQREETIMEVDEPEEEPVDKDKISRSDNSKKSTRKQPTKTRTAVSTKVGKKRVVEVVSTESSDTDMSTTEEDDSSSDEDRPTSSNNRRRGAQNRGGGGGGGKTKATGKRTVTRKAATSSGGGGGASAPRQAVSLKPEQPWKKNLESYHQQKSGSVGQILMADVNACVRAIAKGRLEEISYDDCYKKFLLMNKAYKEGQKMIEALEKARKQETDDKESSSEDEWEEMEHFEPIIDVSVKVTLDKNEAKGKDWRLVYLRQEINRMVRDVWENAHKSHIVGYLAHLNFLVRTSLDESLVPSLMVSQLPQGYLKYVGENIPKDVLQKLVKWYADAFRPLKGVISVTALEEDLVGGQEARYPATQRLTALVASKSFETDCDRAVLLFCLLVGMECTARICVNTKTISRKWDQEMLDEMNVEMEKFREIRSRSGTPMPQSSVTTDDVPTNNGKQKNGKAKKNGGEKPTEYRNYWVEYWCNKLKKWICIDPVGKTVDEPLTIEKMAFAPITYVFAIDNKRGIVDVTQRYSVDCVKQEFRRRRTDPQWLNRTLNLPIFAANYQRVQLEKMELHEELVKRPLPTTMSEYKNHPLYVLEKDLLKFEAIYPLPSKQKELGEIRGHKVYPRSTVYTLQGETNWIKLARSVKIGEKPYKVVKARPDPRVPVEERVEKFLDCFGYWQTEPYRCPKVENGRIPRNIYGNVYMFQPNMCPIGAVHLKLPGLMGISRRLNKECAQAVVGWDFSGGQTHPVMDGACVLKEDADEFIAAWEKQEANREARQEKKRLERVEGNWRKLIRGILRLQYVKKQFKNKEAIEKEKSSGAQKKKGTEKNRVAEATAEHETEHANADTIVDMTAATKPLAGFDLEDLVKF